MPSFTDLTGKRFNRLIVVSRVDNNKHNQPRWLCKCDCGNDSIVVGGALTAKKGSTGSCGCYNKDILHSQKNLLTHGLSRTPTYTVWSSMIQRCTNQKASAYHKYGAKGVTVCPEWSDFRNFFRDMGMRPSLSHSIDRIDNSKGYEPGNCQWSTMKTQQNNRTNNRVISFNNETLTLQQWAERLNLDRKTISTRIDRLGWPLEKALSPGKRINGSC